MDLLTNTSVSQRTSITGSWSAFTLGVLAFVLFAPGALITNSFALDRVILKDGPPASGEIVSINRNEVKIKYRGKDQTYPTADIQKVTFDDEPRELDRARDHFLTEQFDQAVDELKKIDVTEVKQAHIRQDIQFYYHYCNGQLGLAGKGDMAKAKAGLLGLARENSQSHHWYTLCDLLGQMSLAMGEDANPYFQELVSSSSSEIKLLGEYRLATSELATDPSAARKRFQTVANSNVSSPEVLRIQRLANVGLAECDMADGKANDALKQLNALIDKYDSTDHELFAKINNTKGACYEKLDKPEQALLYYLATDLMFYTDAQAHAESLYHLSKLWPRAGEPARASEAKSRLTQSYASSPWATKE